MGGWVSEISDGLEVKVNISNDPRPSRIWKKTAQLQRRPKHSPCLEESNDMVLAQVHDFKLRIGRGSWIESARDA
jgi:hypothetical protein